MIAARRAKKPTNPPEERVDSWLPERIIESLNELKDEGGDSDESEWVLVITKNKSVPHK